MEGFVVVPFVFCFFCFCLCCRFVVFVVFIYSVQERKTGVLALSLISCLVENVTQ